MAHAHSCTWWDSDFTVCNCGKDPPAAKTGPEVGRKDDAGKLRWSLLPIRSLRPIVRVLMFGARKYGDHNWRKVADARERYYDAAIRHLTAWWEGEVMDPDTGESHLAHAGCCVLFLLGL